MSPAFRTLAVLAAATTLTLIGTATSAQAEPER